ncbi:MAG: hypothetical protein ACOYMF_09880 [Bacteroidales bacterium]
MLLLILDYLTDTFKTSLTSATGILIGQVTIATELSVANTALQHTAWTVAIVAGILTIANLFFPLRSFYEKRKLSHHEKSLKKHKL